MPSFDLDPFLTSVVLFSIFIAILLLIVSFTNRNPSRKGKQKPKVNSHGVPQVSAEAYREHMETLRSDGYSSQNVSEINEIWVLIMQVPRILVRIVRPQKILVPIMQLPTIPV